MKYVVVTGVSTGIGYAIAAELAAGGYHVFGSVRKKADAERLQSELGDTFTPLLFDVTKAEQIQAAADQVTQVVGDNGLAGLVNNAGIAVGGPLMHIDIEEVRWQLEVNVIGVLLVTQAFLPLLGARKDTPHPPGKIINISSVGGQVAGPFLGPYIASKHALEGLSHTLRRELLLYGIDVIIIGPGAVESAIWDKAEEVDTSLYADTDYHNILIRFMKGFTRDSREHALPASDIGQLCREILANPRPKVRYAPVPRRLMNWLIPRYLPARMLDNAIKGQLFSGGQDEPSA